MLEIPIGRQAGEPCALQFGAFHGVGLVAKQRMEGIQQVEVFGEAGLREFESANLIPIPLQLLCRFKQDGLIDDRFGTNIFLGAEMGRTPFNQP